MKTVSVRSYTCLVIVITPELFTVRELFPRQTAYSHFLTAITVTIMLAVSVCFDPFVDVVVLSPEGA